MLNIAIYNTGSLEAVGSPDLWFSAEDLQFIMENETARSDLIHKFGEGICIGVLGTETAEGFVESEVSVEILPDDMRKGDLSFYEKL